jgi:hypothetical protein
VCWYKVVELCHEVTLGHNPRWSGAPRAPPPSAPPPTRPRAGRRCRRAGVRGRRTPSRSATARRCPAPLFCIPPHPSPPRHPSSLSVSPRHLVTSPRHLTARHLVTSPRHLTSSPHLVISPRHLTSSPRHHTSSPHLVTSSPHLGAPGALLGLTIRGPRAAAHAGHAAVHLLVAPDATVVLAPRCR